MKKLNSMHKGFTLLELLLVLALMAILAIGGLGIYQIQLRNFKVDKTSLQMQQWLQAGMAFYVDCGKWPADSTIDPNILSAMMGQSLLTPNECPAFAGKLRAYMPAGSDISGPFPNSYQIGPYGSSQNMFQVSTYLSGNVDTMAFVGNMIAGRLPNATSIVELAKNPPQVLVQAMVNVPGQSIQDNHGFILNMQMVASTKLSSVKMPQQSDCSIGMSPILVNAISNFQAPTTRGVRAGSFETTTESKPNAAGLITPTLVIYGAGNASNDKESLGKNQVLLISACIPNNTSTNLQTQSSPDSGLRY